MSRRPRLLDGCCGAGGSARGYTDAGFQVYGVDSDARLEHDYLLSGAIAFHRSDILAVLGDVRYVRAFDLVHVSPPCFPAGTPVTTARGVLPIESVRTGDLVLTHQGRWRLVTATMSRQADVYAAGWLASTADHPFWARDYIKGHGNPYYSNGQTRWTLSEPAWIPAGELHGKFIAIPAVAEALPVPPVPDRKTIRGTPVMVNTEFWWIVGRWLGDGWLRITEPDPAPAIKPPPLSQVPELCLQCGMPTPRHNRYAHLWTRYCSRKCRATASRARRTTPRHLVIICCGSHEAEGLESKLAGLGLTWTRTTERTTVRFQASHAGLAYWLRDNFGHGAATKTIPGWLLSANPDVKQSFLDGYLSADGSSVPAGQRLGTVSSGIAFGIRQLATTLGYTSDVYRSIRPATAVIEGRTINQQSMWYVSIKKDDHRYTRTSNLHRWVKQRRAMTFRGRETVYDLTVEEDHSFIAWGFAVHNCQHYSQMSRCRPGLAARYPDLIGPVRELLLAAGVPYVIENVAAARPWLKDPVTLCGVMFGRPVYRHRLFEAGNGITLTAPAASPSSMAAFLAPRNHECGWPHPVPAAKAGHWKPGYYVSVSGHERKEPVREAMAINWMRNRDDVAEAIPPYMTHEIGRQALGQL